ncbi:MAG: methyltransferase domain-containing protein [Alphaproteobacteria bacterium]|nr:methyltransferase domain-containing protein [Alphaproteobacteria bacterium]
MSNPLTKLAEYLPHKGITAIGRHLWHDMIGFAEDFWHDGNGEMPAPVSAATAENAGTAAEAVTAAPVEEGGWHAKAGEISEKMWGDGYVTPGDEVLTERLITPLGINKNMSILDLSAGLGGRLRKTAADFGVYVSGLEPDAEIAKRGMQMSVSAGLGKKAEIVHYEPMSLKVARGYDCVLARETIYRVPDKAAFINLIVACCKPKSQISFTDYIVNAEVRDAPAIVAWRAFESGADPIGLVEMAELWAKAGFNLRVHEDQTDFYKKEVKAGLVRLAAFMKTVEKPDTVTRKAIAKRITTWAHRVAAMDAGMKFYRFYGLR